MRDALRCWLAGEAESACDRLATGLGVIGPVSSLHPLRGTCTRQCTSREAPMQRVPPQPLNVFFGGVVLHVERQDLVVAIALKRRCRHSLVQAWATNTQGHAQQTSVGALVSASQPRNMIAALS